MNYLKNRLYRFIIYLLMKEKGSVVTGFGSIISPRDLAIRRSIKLSNRMADFKKLIIPVVLSNKDVRRYGSKGDGGYFVATRAVKKSEFLISGGISNNNDFEIELANLGIKGIQIDNSIDEAPAFHKNLDFIKRTLGNRKEIDLDRLFEDLSKNKTGILKLDIEGAEYEVLYNLKNIKRFSAIIVEFHGLFAISDDKFWLKLSNIIKKINMQHKIIYVAPNNCCDFSIIGGVPVPNVIEVTWIRNDMLKIRKYRKIKMLHPEKQIGNYNNFANLDITNLFPNLSL